ncbi:MAG: cytochrome c oxidase subunit III, partial [Bacteroidetes bacterium]
VLGLSLAFLVLQFFAWRSLFAQNVFINTDNSASYLYLLSGLHFLHVVGGLPFLIWFWRQARKRLREPVSELVYFSDPDKRLKLRLLTLYWHFLDGLWIYLVLFFWVNKVL